MHTKLHTNLGCDVKNKSMQEDDVSKIWKVIISVGVTINYRVIIGCRNNVIVKCCLYSSVSSN